MDKAFTLSEDGTQLSHNVLVLVGDDLENIRWKVLTKN